MIRVADSGHNYNILADCVLNISACYWILFRLESKTQNGGPVVDGPADSALQSRPNWVSTIIGHRKNLGFDSDPECATMSGNKAGHRCAMSAKIAMRILGGRGYGVSGRNTAVE